MSVRARNRSGKPLRCLPCADWQLSSLRPCISTRGPSEACVRSQQNDEGNTGAAGRPEVFPEHHPGAHGRGNPRGSRWDDFLGQQGRPSHARREHGRGPRRKSPRLLHALPALLPQQPRAEGMRVPRAPRHRRRGDQGRHRQRVAARTGAGLDAQGSNPRSRFRRRPQRILRRHHRRRHGGGGCREAVRGLLRRQSRAGHHLPAR